MKVLIGMLAITVFVGLTGCATIDNLFEEEEAVALSEVPAPVIAAAKDAVKGIVLIEAEMEKEDGQTVYDLEGTADGKTYRIEVTPEGKVIEIEQE